MGIYLIFSDTTTDRPCLRLKKTRMHKKKSFIILSTFAFMALNNNSGKVVNELSNIFEVFSVVCDDVARFVLAVSFLILQHDLHDHKYAWLK